MKSRTSILRRIACVVIPFATVIGGLVVACGSDHPDAAGDGTSFAPPADGYCKTPNEGCPCQSPGQVVPCGSVHSTGPDGYVVCQMGERTCQGSAWGACVPGGTVAADGETKTKSYVIGGGLATTSAGGGVHPLDLGSSVDCTGGSLSLGALLCVGGTKDGKICDNKPKCPGGACSAGTCNGGSNDDAACAGDADCPGGSCLIGDGKCVGGSQSGEGCKPDCPNGTCTIFVGVCNGGANDGNGCNLDTECPSGTCDATIKGECVGGTNDAKKCKDASKCPGGTCYLPDSGASFFNPCDPYCQQFVDTPVGALFDGGVVTDGGLTIPPNAAPDAGDAGTTGGGAPIFTGTNGLNQCAGSHDVITNPCSGNPNQNCQQDFHCEADAGSPDFDTCVWNVPTLYTDTACNGVDLTAGAGCDQGANFELPICNRGTQTLPAGKTIRIKIVNQGGFNSWNANCAAGAGAPDCSVTLTAPLGPGQCMQTTACGTPSGQRWAIVNSDNSIAECGAPGASCKNNASQVKSNGAGCATCSCLSNTAEVIGTIMDPAKRRPVYGVSLYVPSTPLTAFTPSVSCDTCDNIYSGLPAIASTTTDADGKFRLQGVPAGTTFTLVIQLGRFRRQVQVGPIAACGSYTLPSAQAHLPATHTKTGDTAGDLADPDLPLIAMVTGNGDATECLLARMGFATSEFTVPGGGGRIEMYTYKKNNGLTGGSGSYGAGAKLGGGAAGAADALLGNAATLGKYNALIMPCGNQASGQHPTAAMQQNVQDWMNAGGRMFASHIANEDFVHFPVGNQNDGQATWSTPSRWGNNNPDANDRSSGGYSLTDDFNQTFPKGAAMARWFQAAWPSPGGPGGALPAFGKIPLPDWRNNVKAVPATSTSWFWGTSTYNGPGKGLQHNMVSFNTPVSAPPASQCGRAVMPFMHVSSTSSGTFPSECGSVPNSLNAQELAFEFMMWESMTCLSPSTVPPTAPPPGPPEPPPPLEPFTFTRDFQGVCAPGEVVRWEPFFWEADVPSGTSIDFHAATATTQAGLPAASPDAPPAPASRAIGSATSTVLAPLWSCDGCPGAPVSVDYHLKNDPPPPNTGSQSWLRVYMTFNPAGAISPTLMAWRQTYDCVPGE
jgi:hypothetical protein